MTHKTQFEQIIGLEEEYKNEAIDVISDLERTKMIIGIEIISAQIEKDPSIHKKLVRLSKIGSYKDLNKNTIKNMQAIAIEFEDKELKVKNGKLHIENEEDIDLALKMLCDFYKQGKVSGQNYGTY